MSESAVSRQLAAIRIVLDRPWHAAVAAAVAVMIVATALTVFGVRYAEAALPHGRGYDAEMTGAHALFRFDSEYYLSVANDGYRYDGEPCRSQNVVFMPGFPLLVRAVSAVGVPPVDAGFWIVRLSLLAASIVLFRLVAIDHGKSAGLFVLLGLHFSAGSWAFHAWYSESVMLLSLVLALYAYRTRRSIPLALAAGFLGATRVTVAPFVALFALRFVWRAIDRLRRGGAGAVPAAAGETGLALVSVSGLAGYFGLLWFRFGDPFALISSIKYCAWSRFHQPMSLVDLLTFRDLWTRLTEALARTEPLLTDVRTTSLIWTVLALLACVVPIVRRRVDLTVVGFCGYFLLTYYATGKSEWLQSNYRYFASMFTIYVMAWEAYRGLATRFPRIAVRAVFLALFGLNATYMWVYLTRFVAGTWFYF